MIPRTRRVCKVVKDVANGPQPPLEMVQVCDTLRDQALGAGVVFVDPLAETGSLVCEGRAGRPFAQDAVGSIGTSTVASSER